MLIPGEPLVYTRINGVVWAQYKNPPHNKLPKFIIGGYNLKKLPLSLRDMEIICELAEENLMMKNALNNLIATYFLLKGKQ